MKKVKDEVLMVIIAVMNSVGILFLFFRITGRSVEQVDTILGSALLFLLTILFLLVCKRDKFAGYKNERLEQKI